MVAVLADTTEQDSPVAVLLEVVDQITILVQVPEELMEIQEAQDLQELMDLVAAAEVEAQQDHLVVEDLVVMDQIIQVLFREQLV